MTNRRSLASKFCRLEEIFGGYIADIVGDLPKDLVGLLAGDRVKVARAKRLAILLEGTKKHLQDRGVVEPEPPSLKLALPIFEAAADESNQELQDLWASLLAAAMDPKRRDWVRQSFIQIVKQMDPFDVLVLRAVAENGLKYWSPNGRDVIMARTNGSMHPVLVSFGNLADWTASLSSTRRGLGLIRI